MSGTYSQDAAVRMKNIPVPKQPNITRLKGPSGPPAFEPGPPSERARAALREFAAVAIPFLRSRAAGGRIPVVAITNTMFSDTDVRHWEQTLRQRDIEAIPFAAVDYHELLAIPAAQEGVRALWEEGQLPVPQAWDNEGNPITKRPFEKMLSQLGQLPLDTVKRYVSERGTFDGDLQVEQLESAFLATQETRKETIVDVLASAPLKYFEMPADRIEFPDGVAIERMTGADKANLWNDGYLDYYFTKAELANTWFRLTARYQSPRSKVHSGRDVTPRFDRVISALRLVQPGHTEAPTLVIEQVPRKPPTGMSGGNKSRDTTSLAFFEVKKYRFELTNVSELLRVDSLLAGVQAGGSHVSFELALRRFNQSFHRGEREDSVIDLAIALESTLLAGLKDELKYRLAMRGAALLRDVHDPKEVHDFLLRLYDVRSAIVHNGNRLHELKSKLLGSTPSHEFVPTAQYLVRQVLLRCLELLSSGKSLSELAASLDAGVVASLGAPPPSKASG